MGKNRIKPNRRRVLRLPDLDHCKASVLDSLGSPASRRVYENASTILHIQLTTDAEPGERPIRYTRPLIEGENCAQRNRRNCLYQCQDGPPGRSSPSPVRPGRSDPRREGMHQLRRTSIPGEHHPFCHIRELELVSRPRCARQSCCAPKFHSNCRPSLGASRQNQQMDYGVRTHGETINEKQINEKQ